MQICLRFAPAVSATFMALVVATGLLMAGSGPTRYRIEDLGTFGGPEGCENGVHPTFAGANGLNELGDAVGWAERSVHLLDPDNGEPLYYPDTGHAVCTKTFHGALWRDGEIIDLGALAEGARAQGNRVNDHDHVVGESYGGSLYSAHPFLWTEEDGMIDLLPDDPTLRGTSWGINNFGEITINAGAAYFRDVSGELRVIKYPDSPFDGNGSAFEINDDGIVAGYAERENLLNMHGFRYDSQADIVEDIHDPFYRRSYAYGVNPQGDIAVRMVAYTGHGFASVVTADATLAVLPLGNIRYRGELRPDLLLGGVDDVNAHGDVVGTDVSAAPLPPVAWVAFDVFGDGPVEKIPLEDLLSPEDRAEWEELNWAWEMNDARQMAGRGVHNGRSRAFLMTPDETASDTEASMPAAATAVPAGKPVAANRAVIDAATGLPGVTKFVPEGMGSNREIGSLRPRSPLEAREVGGRDLEGRLATVTGDRSARIVPRTPPPAPPDTSAGTGSEPVAETPTPETTRREEVSRVAPEACEHRDR